MLSSISERCIAPKCAEAISRWWKVDSLSQITDRDLDALDEEDESECAEEIHEYAKQHKEEFISFEEYCIRRGISL